ncbi:NUDIX domain-containing protein [Galbitalea sp. SE-J8]|uniref:NUDIX domain-containing protein n=1 Tax=Galbitalea sp. SE-J8 TaxID=3054952 RepID=UPI00259D2C1D|nr:NUDIX domain-containing protein [Galbitalea sp. SE-J8]MDM4763856.1 NUDIX domain-containing protein [Galbitalea sp. SE-J8]
MAEHSAGILVYRRRPRPEVYLGHMGGPFWSRRDSGSWSIPKGTLLPGEAPLDAALREFAEEVGTPAPAADYVELGSFRYASGKIVTVFAAESDAVPVEAHSNTFSIEWPPRSGQQREFPEIDRVAWFRLEEARDRLVVGQRSAIDALEALLTR